MNPYDKEIVSGFETIKKTAIEMSHKNDISQAIMWADHAIMVANQMNWKYNDEQLNNLMDDLSTQIIKPRNGKYQSTPKRVVFYDQYGKSFILALQYINALTIAGYQILYILSDFADENRDTFIIEELQKKENVIVEVIPPKLDYLQRVRRIYQLTMEYAPGKAFLHVKAFSVFNLVLPSLPSKITKYYIDLQDHALWIKNNNLDFVIPYRDWGATIDIEKRGFSKKQVLKLPYYPIVTKTSFQGFPQATNGKVVIFTGGNYYKTIDYNNTYWKLIVRVLNENPDTIVLYAGKGDTDGQKQALQQFANEKDLSNRLIPIGFRADINEVFAHCDIFMGTCPMSGGLMCQYAAYNGKPILQYYRPDMAANNETEQVLNYNGTLDISFTDVNAFLAEAKHLIDDDAYRKTQGEKLRKILIRKDQFDELFKHTITSNQSQIVVTMQKIDYDAFTRWWFFLEKKGISNCRDYLLSLLKRKKYFVMPLSAIKKRMHTLK